MPHPILHSLKLRKQDITILHGIHWVARGILQSQDYKWELRRTGETKLGYWRKTLRKRNSRSAYPKRFVLIPGFGDTPLSWQGVITLLTPVLKLHFDEVILFDFPGFGGFLSRERSFPSLDLMMTSLNDTLDSLKPHTILGHSLGGWLAAHYASLCGEGVRPTANKLNYSGPKKVLLANPSGIFPSLEVRNVWENIFRDAMVEGFKSIGPHLFAKKPFWFGLLSTHFNEFLSKDDILQFMKSFREDHCLDRAVEKIQSDVWLIWGEKDTLVPASCAPAWLQHLSHSRKNQHHSVLIKDAGHSPHLEKPAVTAAVIGQILYEKTPHRYGRRWWKVPSREAHIIR